jgi:DNA-directed RNA polymerase specialized sigma24 family protein
MYCDAPLPDIPQDLARRVYAYFIFRLRPPADAERLTRLTLERVWEAERTQRDVDLEAELPMFAAARAVLAESPRPRGAERVAPSPARGQGGDGANQLSDALALAIGRLHGREREALALRFGAELSVGEIAQLLDRTPADVKQRLARGVRNLIQLGVLPEASEKSAAEGPGTGGAEQGEAEQE